MKKIISGLSVLVAAAAKNEVFTLAVIVAFIVVAVAKLVQGCEIRKNDIWEVL